MSLHSLWNKRYRPESMMYALMLLDRAEVIREFDSLDEAKAALERFVAEEPSLDEVAGILQLDDGKPVGDPIVFAGVGEFR